MAPLQQQRGIGVKFSHSRVEAFKSCPYKYWLKYIEGIGALPNLDDAANALLVGSGIHKAIEAGLAEGVAEYLGSYPIIGDLHENEVIKFADLVPKVQALLDGLDVTYEYKLDCPEFVGFIDALIKREDGAYTIYDFKYTAPSNAERYRDSPQLHLYKHYFELLNPGKVVSGLGYILIPKTSIRQKKTEDLCDFRKRLKDTLAGLTPQIIQVDYDASKVEQYFADIDTITQAQEFPKNETRLCDWCDYQLYCQQGFDYMLLPSNTKRIVDPASRIKIWIYGAPFSGKTTLADHFPDAVMLNTDGNLNSFLSPVVEIKETFEGRIKVSAWDNFKAAIDELQKGKHQFKTIVVDLVEDTYEHCRRWSYDKLGIEHESDNSFKAWDFVRNEFLTVYKKLMTLPYNIVLISHEDVSRDLTKKTGDKITTIRPNIQDKLANKLAGMVDIVGRVVADGDERTINFKSTDVVFGGGRLYLTKTTIPCTFEALDQVYLHQPRPGAQVQPIEAAPAQPVEQAPIPAVQVEAPTQTPAAPVEATPAPAAEPAPEGEPVRRRRRVRAE